MKKCRKMVMIGAVLMMTGNITAFAGTWRSDDIGWWYEKEDGSYASFEWVEDNGKLYYFNLDGYMAANTWIGDNYVGADGAWIPWAAAYPVADYHNLIASDQMYQPSLRGELSDVVDCGDYYEIKNQKLYRIKQYDTKKEAEAEKEYRSDRVDKLPNGKYVICAENDWMSHELVYSGSIYMNKNVVFRYNGDKITTFEDYLQRIEEIGISSGNGRRIGAMIEGVDEKGYVTQLSFAILDYLP